MRRCGLCLGQRLAHVQVLRFREASDASASAEEVEGAARPSVSRASFSELVTGGTGGKAVVLLKTCFWLQDFFLFLKVVLKTMVLLEVVFFGDGVPKVLLIVVPIMMFADQYH